MAEAAADIFVDKVVEPAVDSIWRQISYVWNYRNNIQSLRDGEKKLKDRKAAVQHQVDEAIRNAEAIEDEVAHWLARVDKTIVAAKKILVDNDAAKQRCFMGCRPSLKSRHQLSRNATKKIVVIEEVRGEENFRRISYRTALDVVPVKDYEAFESRSAIFDQIVEALKDADVNMVGVYGMGGVGKTTLANKVAERLRVKENETFKVVVLSTITKNVDLKRIQQEIAEFLGLKLDEEITTTRASRLYLRLKQEEKFLLILDDLWDTVNLVEIGIPFGHDHKGCKLLMTSRDQNVLRKMDLESNCFRLNVLEDQEAKDLFLKKAGPLDNPEMQAIASEVAERCGGLPVLIVTVARSLKGRNLYEWEVAVNKLKHKEMDKKVQSGLELSYNFLEEDEIKSLFLLCGQLLSVSNQIDVELLLKYVVGLSLFNNCQTLEDVRNKLLKYVSDLKSCCFLEEGTEEGEVKMHDIILDFAVSKYRHFFTVVNGKVSHCQPKKELEQCTAIYLDRVKFDELPSTSKFPRLHTFYMRSRGDSLEIPDYPFSTTNELRVLHLKKLYLSPLLPSSIQILENLQTLSLEHCTLGDISLIGKLKNLQVLSLAHSNIVKLPRNLEQLTSLQLLDLTDCSHLKVVPRNVLSKLIQLEELRMGNGFKQWEGEGQDDRRENASLSELRRLPKLIALDIHITDASILRRGFFSEKLKRFRIFLGDGWQPFHWYDAYTKSKVMKLKLITGIQLEEVKGLLKKTEDLYLDELKGVKNFHDDEGFPQLKRLHIKNDLDIEYIIDCPRMTAFPMLELLSLNNLNKLEMIYHGQFVIGSFSKLRILKVEKCNQLKNLFSFTVLKALVLVEEIKINHCQILKEVAAAETGEDFDIELPQFRELKLGNLPHLTGFCTQVNLPLQRSATTFTGSDEIVLEDESTTLSLLFDQKVQLRNLESLSLDNLNNLEIIYGGHYVMGSFIKLRILDVVKCDRLKNLFSFSILKGLVQLEEIYVRDCQGLKEIVATETREDSVSVETIQFPPLQKLKLKNLPQLTRFCTGKLIECPSLKEVWIEECPSLQKIVSNSTITDARSDIGVQLPNLESLSMDNLEMIYFGHYVMGSFTKLRILKVRNCDRLKNLFSSSILKGLLQLEEIDVSNCQALKEIVATETGEDSASEEIIQLPLLQKLNLINLSQFTSFCIGKMIECPSLKVVHIQKCPLLQKFLSSSRIRDARSDRGVEQPYSTLFNEKVLLPNLESLNLDNLDMIYCGYYEMGSFTKLKILKVGNCYRLKNLFSFSILKSLVQLEEIDVSNCLVLKEIVATERTEDSASEEIIQLPQLQKLKLENLSKLTRFCTGNLIECPSMKVVHIENCPRLKEFVTSSTNTDAGSSSKVGQLNSTLINEKVQFPNLESLKVGNCDRLENLLSSSIIQLPQLQKLELDNLSRLTRFSSGKLIECPSLKEVHIEKCPLLQEFVTSSTIADAGSSSEVRQLNAALFNEKVLFPNLEILTITRMEKLEKIWDDELHEDSFCQLKELRVFEGKALLKIFPSKQLRRFKSIETLWIKDCYLIEEVFDVEVLMETKNQTPSQLSVLAVAQLPRLENVWKGDPRGCGIKLFCNLKTIHAWECPRLKYIFPFSIAQSLLQLHKLYIKDCELLEEIVSKGESAEATPKFEYPQLESLTLRGVHKLKYFYPEKHILKCPQSAKLEGSDIAPV